MMKPLELVTPVKVIIADDHVLFRAGVKTALGTKKDIRLIGEADNGQQLLHLLKHLQPDVVLLDIQMPIMDGIKTLPELRKNYPDMKIIMLTMHNEHSMISKLMELGANAYLTKDSDSEVIYEAIRTCYQNEYFFNEKTNIALLDGLKNRNNESPGAQEAKLTDKEKHILKLMCEEKSTKEIADEVGLSPRTVEAIRDKLKSKLGVRSMAGLVRYAIRVGIIDDK